MSDDGRCKAGYEFRRAAIEQCRAAGLDLPKKSLRNDDLAWAMRELETSTVAVVQAGLCARLINRGAPSVTRSADPSSFGDRGRGVSRT
jgi:hypothetical protein